MFKSNIAIFTFPECIHCFKAKEIPKAHNLGFTEYLYNEDFNFDTIKAFGGGIPQIFIDGKHLGGEKELAKWLSEEQAPP